MRNEFEKWATTQDLALGRHHSVQDRYYCLATEYAWKAWQTATSNTIVTDAGMKARSDAWLAVCTVLGTRVPSWFDAGCSGKEAAVATINELIDKSEGSSASDKPEIVIEPLKSVRQYLVYIQVGNVRIELVDGGICSTAKDAINLASELASTIDLEITIK